MDRISGRFSVIFISAFLLALVSAGGTAWSLRAQSSDALVINLAGRQRMLIQWMARLAAEPAPSPGERAALAEARQAFDETLLAFQHGGTVHYPAGVAVSVPAGRDPGVRAQLARLDADWQAYRAGLDDLGAAQPGSAQRREAQAALNTLSPGLLAQADGVVRAYQQVANRRIAALGRLQAIFFSGVALLLLAGAWLASRAILRPLQALEQAAGRIGAGDLDTPVRVHAPYEISVLGAAVDAMRQSLLASRQELLAWNRSLEAGVAERTRELDALYEVSREIASRLDPEAVFQSITAKAQALLKADSAYLCLLDGGGQALHLHALSGPEEALLQVAAGVENPFVRATLAEHGAHCCPAGGCRASCGMVDERFRRSHIAASLWAENRVIGALCVGSRSQAAFGDDGAQLLDRLAGAAALAIENARLYRQAERLAALEERQRIAAAIHDGLAQTIDSLGLLVDQAGERLENGAPDAARRALERAYERIRHASGEVRQAIAGLQDEPPLPAAIQDRLRELIGRIAAESGPPLEWQVDLPGALALREADALQVIGIAGEALQNARRHAAAGRICVRLAVDGDAAFLRIEDDGCGFNLGVLPEDGRRHFGLQILQARAAQLEGKLEIVSAPGRGTAMTLAWPVRRSLAGAPVPRAQA